MEMVTGTLLFTIAIFLLDFVESRPSDREVRNNYYKYELSKISDRDGEIFQHIRDIEGGGEEYLELDPHDRTPIFIHKDIITPKGPINHIRRVAGWNHVSQILGPPPAQSQQTQPPQTQPPQAQPPQAESSEKPGPSQSPPRKKRNKGKAKMYE